MDRNIPPVLRVGLCVLAIITILTFFAGLSHPSPRVVVTVFANVALLIGLYLGHRWAFVLALVTGGLGIIIALSQNVSRGLLVLLGNGLVIVPVILCWEYYFVRRSPRQERFVERG